MGAPVLMGMGMGAITSLAMGNDPLKGAILGGVTGGAFGGAEGFGSGFGQGGLFSLGSEGLQGATSAVTPSLGSGGYQALNAVPTAATYGASSGLTTSIPQTTGEYSSIYGGNSALQNYDVGMGGIKSNFGVQNTPTFQGGAIGSPSPNWTGTNVSTNGYVLTDAEKNILEHGGLTGTEGTVPEGAIDEKPKSIWDIMSEPKQYQQPAMMFAQNLLNRQDVKDIPTPPAKINVGKPVDVNNAGTGILDIPSFINDVKKNQIRSLFSR